MNEQKHKLLDEKLANDIEKYGLQVLRVLEDESGPGFSDSIGLFETYKHPEILIIGLKQELSHTLINNMAEEIKSGHNYAPLNFYPDILTNFECYISNVDPQYYDEYVGQAQRFYGENEFPLIQCIYPTVKGIYPWEKDWPMEIKDLQPILGEVKLG